MHKHDSDPGSSKHRDRSEPLARGLVLRDVGNVARKLRGREATKRRQSLQGHAGDGGNDVAGKIENRRCCPHPVVLSHRRR